MSDLKLYTTAALIDEQLDEYSALHVMPHNHHRDHAIENFRKTLEEADIEALLTTGDEVGPGSLVLPVEVTVYDLHMDYGMASSIQRAYGKVQLRQLVYSNLLDDHGCEDEVEGFMAEDIDIGTILGFWMNREWVEYRVVMAVVEPEQPEVVVAPEDHAQLISASACRAEQEKRLQLPGEVETGSKLRLYTDANLTDGQICEYSALCMMPASRGRAERIEEFRQELADAGLDAILTFEEVKGAGRLLESVTVYIYDICYNYEWVEDTVRVYGWRELHRNLHENFIEIGYYMEEAEALTQEDIDHGSPLLWKLIDQQLQENRRWIEYDYNVV